jgi:hypothetical protein
MLCQSRLHLVTFELGKVGTKCMTHNLVFLRYDTPPQYTREETGFIHLVYGKNYLSCS